MEPGNIDNKASDEVHIAQLGDSLRRLVSEKKERHLRNLLRKDSVKKHVIANAWQIVPDLCAAFSNERERCNPSLLQPIEEVLLLLSETCVPKELLILLVEQLKEKNDALFRALLVPVQKCLLRITSKRAHSCAFVLKSFYDYVATLPLPSQQVFEGRERLLLDLDENVRRIVAVLPCFLQFLSPLVSELAWETEKGPEQKPRLRSEKEVDDMTACLIRVLHCPLAFLDLSHVVAGTARPAAKSSSRVCAETVIGLLGRLRPDLVKTVFRVRDENERAEVKARRETVSDSKDSVEDAADAVPVLGLGTLAYLLFSENLSVDRIPLVYSRRFLFEFNLPCMLCLLQRSEPLAIHKGLLLGSALLTPLAPQSWSADFLECAGSLELIKSVVFVAASAKSGELSELALQVLVTLLKMFETGARVKLLHYLLTVTPRGHVTGYVITMLRNEIDDALEERKPGYFGPAMDRLLTLVFALPNGEKTDLLDNSERVVGALNLLRFLLLRDGPNENATGIWNLMPAIEGKYFQALGAGIGLSRAHYRLQLRNVGESASGEQTSAETSDGRRTMTKHEQMRAMQMAINTFDKMEGILGGVTEELQRRKKERADREICSV